MHEAVCILQAAFKNTSPIIPHAPTDIPKPYKHPHYQECWQSPVYFRISFQMKNNQVQNVRPPPQYKKTALRKKAAFLNKFWAIGGGEPQTILLKSKCIFTDIYQHCHSCPIKLAA